jgi:lathosterol oxidase
MDVVLEILDTFFFDRLYANALPIHSQVSTFDPVSTIAASLKGFASNSNHTFTPPAESAFTSSAWQFTPATSYWSLQPSEYAYMSRWDRDNIYRQTLSLYFTTW